MTTANPKRRGLLVEAPSNPSKKLQSGSSVTGHRSPNFLSPSVGLNGVEDEMMDEDVFLEENLLKYGEDEESLRLLEDEARLSKWKRGAGSDRERRGAAGFPGLRKQWKTAQNRRMTNSTEPRKAEGMTMQQE
ncbi:DNA polymerase delta catalytic subunit [Apostasia shenzhenica]|uniref:DNA polymerase delta catalytic subunit n=1 Tax=Apostasia shenzhenica TaxID=1088818 RepID=A0A2I0ANP0_9ASPA|nr:DNA polymerase delta catalytic subunit [Apostasia shenzhenica]